MPIPHSSDFELAASWQKAKKRIFELAVLDEGGSVIGTLSPSGGSLTRDRTRPIRADGTWTCHGNLSSLMPPGTDPRVLLPRGTEVRISRGFEYRDGTQELLTRATLRITKTDLSVDLTNGTGVAFQGSDRAERLDRQQLNLFDATPGEHLDTVLVRLLEQAWRGANPNASVPRFHFQAAVDPVTGVPFTVPLLHYEAKTQAWTAGQKLADASGMELFVDYDAAIALAPLPDRTDAPVWYFIDGQHDTRVRLAQSYDSSATKNYWTVNAVGPGMPSGPGAYSGVAYIGDLDSASLDINGSYGTNPEWIDSQLATSPAMCVAEANTAKAKTLRGTDVIIIETTPIDFLLEGDVIGASNANLEMGDEVYVVTSIVEPLTAEGTMVVTAGRG